jgi:acyl transferase domain-containing protein
MAVDTACSSSLVAIHLACQSLKRGESDLALAGGVNVVLARPTQQLVSKVQFLSPEGRCKTFDAEANGFVRGEACGLVVLKRLSDAHRASDPILALILSSAVNQDGRSTGFTTPNVLAQQALLRQALESARLSPEEIGYIEAHGTGTSLGDPIEVEALAAVLGKARADGSVCALGAVKTNIGHSESAAGVTGLMKVVLALKNEAIPPNLHFRTLNPRIALEGTPFVIPTQKLPWKVGKPRVAGVSSFGMSGTNAHVLLQEAPRSVASEPDESAAAEPEARALLLPLSGRSEAALFALARAYQRFLSESSRDASLRLQDIAYTASVRRSHHEHRLSLVARSRAELAQELDALVRGDAPFGVRQGPAKLGPRPKVVFVFSGMGSHWVGMGRELLSEEPAFRAALLSCDAAIQREAGWSLVEELAADESRSRLEQIDVIQPALFAVGVALSALWRAWGVEPDVVVGHSLGEVAAACAAGAVSMDDAVRIVCLRSRLLRKVTGNGGMALVELSMAEAEQMLAGYHDRLFVAASNGPRSTVLSGDAAALEEVLTRLQQDNVFCRRVKVDVALHTPQVDPLLEELLAGIRDIAPRMASVPMRSTVTGGMVRGDELAAAYWAQNLRRPVLFSQVTQQLIEDGHAVFLEMSPHPVLLPSIEENLREWKRDGAALASLRRSAEERRSLLDSLGALYSLGYPVDWKRLYPHGTCVVTLPTYPFQRERYWIAASSIRFERLPHASPTPDAEEQSLFFASMWHLAEPQAGEAVADADPRPPRTRAPGGRWLLFSNGTELGKEVHALLSSRGETVLRVAARGSAMAEEPGGEIVDPAAPESFDLLLQRAFADGALCRGVIHLFCTDALDAEPISTASLAASQTLGCGSVLHLVQALSRTGFRNMPRLFLVTRGTQSVEQEDRTHRDIAIAHASVWGLGRTISLEHPELRCVRLDLDSLAPAGEARALFQELLSDPREEEIAWRAGRRYAGRLGKAPAPSARRAEQAGAPSVVRADATYVITGGLGGLGLLSARWLSEAGARHLLLLGRRGVVREAQAEAIAALESAGASVMVATADVADPVALEGALRDAQGRMPPVRGVLHAAGVLDDGLLVGQDMERFHKVFAPKVLGAWNLHLSTLDEPLDFFVLYSSIAALMGPPGLGNYVAANVFLDALAHYRRRRGLPALSINWGLFGGIGMGINAERDRRATHHGIRTFTPEEGGMLLRRLLESDVAQIAAASLKPRQWLELHPLAARSERLSSFLREAQNPRQGKASKSPAIEAALRATAPEMRARLVEQFVLEQAASVLKTDASRVNPRAPLKSLGFDSLMGLELRNRLESGLDLILSATLVWTYPTVAALAEHLTGELRTLPDAPQHDELPVPDVAISRESSSDDELLGAFDTLMGRIEESTKP